MKIAKGVGLAVVLGGLVGLAVVMAPSLHGQSRLGPAPDELAVLPLAGSEIGVSIRDVDPGDRQASGVVIEDVRAGSPAEKAGLKRSDLIVEFDGERVRSVRQLARLVQESVPDRAVAAAIVRDGQRRTVQITPVGRRLDLGIDTERLRERLGRLADRLPLDLDSGSGLASRRLGVVVQEMPRQLADYFGAKEGALVTAVTDDSPASRAGLKAGDVIMSINGETVRTRRDLLRRLDAGTSAVEVTLGIVRDRKETTVRASLEPSHRPSRPRRTA